MPCYYLLYYNYIIYILEVADSFLELMQNNDFL